MTGVKITPIGIPSVLRAVVTNMTNNAFSKIALELAHSHPFSSSFGQGAEFFCFPGWTT